MPALLGGVALADAVLVLGFIVLLMMSRHNPAWMRPIVVGIMHPHTALWKRILTAPARYVLAPAARFVLHFAQVFLAWHAHHLLRPAVAFFHGIGILVAETADLILHFPAEVHWALYYLRHTVIPTLIHAAVWPVRVIAVDAKDLAVALEHDAQAEAGAIASALNGIGWITNADPFGALRNFAHAFAHLWHYVYGELTDGLHTVERGYATLRTKAVELEDYVYGGLTRQLVAMEAALERGLDTIYIDIKPFVDALRAGVIPAAMVTAITAALALVWDGLFCRNTNAVGKRLCGLDGSLLETFLADAFAVVELAGLLELTRELQFVVRETAEGVKALAEV